MRTTFPRICLAFAFCTVIGCSENSTAPVPSNAGSNDPIKSLHINSTCETFAGIDHCPVGTTQLSLAGGTLKVSSFTPAWDTNGVESSFPSATEWQFAADMYGRSGGSNVIRYAAFSGSTPVTRVTLTQAAATDSCQITVNFPSAYKYSATVYQDTILIGAQSGIDISVPFEGRNIEFEMLKNEMQKLSQMQQAMRWDMKYDANITFRLPNGQSFSGNRLVLLEQGAGGVYPSSTINAIRVQGRMDSLIVRSESHN